MTVAHSRTRGKRSVIDHSRPILADVPHAGAASDAHRFGGLAMYLARMDDRPYLIALVGSGVAMLFALLGDVAPAAQGATWIGYLGGASVGIGAVVVQLLKYREDKDRQTRLDNLEREALARYDAKERELRAELRSIEAEYRSRIAELEKEAAHGKERRHAMANAVQADSLKLNAEIAELKAEIARLNRVIAADHRGNA